MIQVVGTLRTFYTRLFRGSVLAAAAVVAFLQAHDVPGWATGVTIAVATTFLAVVRTHGWRLVYPRLDLAGTWIGATTYARPFAMGGADGPDTRGGQEKDHEVRIRQDCFSVRLEPTSSEIFVSWGSHAADIDDDGQLHYAYWVRYKEGPPPRAEGFETLAATKTGWRGRPKRLDGTFSQCVQDVGPVYSGTVWFTRQPSRVATAARSSGRWFGQKAQAARAKIGRRSGGTG